MPLDPAMNYSAKEAVILEWIYSPPDYFETPVQLIRDAYTITIAEGKVNVRVDAFLYYSDTLLEEALHEAVNDWFVGAQLAKRKAYTLSACSVKRVDLNVIAHAQLGPVLSQSTPSAAPADAGASGREMAVPERGRLEGGPGKAEQSDPSSTSDPLLDSLRRRYDLALADPIQEFTRLCAVPIALSTRFGSERAARVALSISESHWSMLFELANIERDRNQAIQEGAVPQCEVSEAQRAQARAITLRMILAYLRYTNRSAVSRLPMSAAGALVSYLRGRGPVEGDAERSRSSAKGSGRPSIGAKPAGAPVDARPVPKLGHGGLLSLFFSHRADRLKKSASVKAR
jgi:hypothetical protein